MKTKLFIIFIFCLVARLAKAQDLEDYLKGDQIFLTINSHNIKFNDIDRKSVIKLIGKPLKIKKEYSEEADVMHVDYIYKGGTITFEKNDIAFVEITKPGWGFTFYKDNKLTPNFIVGSDASSIKEFFPFSLLKKGENFIRITIKTADNVGTESAVLFEIKAGKVKSVSFFTDES